jgi:zinc D-Ala-D-Ala dipeptidase
MARFLARSILLLLGLALAGALAYGVGWLVRKAQMGSVKKPPAVRTPAPRPAQAAGTTHAPLVIPPPSATPVAPTALTAPASAALVELTTVDPGIQLDLRYATPNNFTGKALYPVARAYLRPGTAKKVAAVDADLAKHGYRLKIWDAYRPLSVQKALFKAAPVKGLVTDPKKGSMHNRGAAVDVTLTDSTGVDLEMPTDFDDATDKRRVTYAVASAVAEANRDYLIITMKAHGFRSISNEWWHFDDQTGKAAPLLDIPLDKIDATL